MNEQEAKRHHIGGMRHARTLVDEVRSRMKEAPPGTVFTPEEVLDQAMRAIWDGMRNVKIRL